MLFLYIHYRKESKVVPLAKAQGLHRTCPRACPFRALHPMGYSCKGNDGGDKQKEGPDGEKLRLGEGWREILFDKAAPLTREQLFGMKKKSVYGDLNQPPGRDVTSKVTTQAAGLCQILQSIAFISLMEVLVSWKNTLEHQE